MKIERAWLRIVVSGLGGGVGVLALMYGVLSLVHQAMSRNTGIWLVFFAGFLVTPVAATVLAHVLTPKEPKNGHTRCGKCGYILKGLTEPRCSECGARI